MQREKLSVGRERAILAGLILPGFTGDPHDPLNELRSLADTAGAVSVDEIIQKRVHPDPATFMGKGKIEEIGQLVKMHTAGVVIFENDLTPRQIANIEEYIPTHIVELTGTPTMRDSVTVSLSCHVHQRNFAPTTSNGA